MRRRSPNLSFEKGLLEKGYRLIAGVDEAGRGALAGPVVAAAVIFDSHTSMIEGIDDSKKISPQKRESLYLEITKKAKAYALSLVSPSVIDRINILQATFLSMQRSIKKINPDYLLVDGKLKIPRVNIPQQAIVAGDSKSYSIAAASILAKVFRDRIMQKYDCLYPQYHFSSHKGYGTKKHFLMIKEYGILPIHRRTFLS